MSNEHLLKRLTIGQPAVYRIVVDGLLDEDWSDRLAGMRITAVCDTPYRETTVLEGGVSDQAELVGVLNSLYDLHMPILTVELRDCSRQPL